jgi:hypothetical protein
MRSADLYQQQLAVLKRYAAPMEESKARQRADDAFHFDRQFTVQNEIRAKKYEYPG